MTRATDELSKEDLDKIKEYAELMLLKGKKKNKSCLFFLLYLLVDFVYNINHRTYVCLGGEVNEYRSLLYFR